MLHVLDAPANLPLGLGHGLAVLPGETHGEIVEVLLQQGLQTEQHLHSLHGRSLPPTGKGFLGGPDGGVDIRGVREGDVV
jgi:hypothetical protein